jgi:hypothetical protein
MRFRSSLRSVKRGEPTWLASIETILAIAVYWGIAIYWDTHLHLLVSICVAPLLLLRSPESTEAGARWFYDYLNSRPKISPMRDPSRYMAIVLLAAGISGLATYFLASYLLPGHTGWSLFGWAFLLGALALGITWAIVRSTAATMPIIDKMIDNAAITIITTLTTTVALGVALVKIDVGVGYGALAVAGALAAVLTRAIGLLPVAVTLVFGLWLRSLGIRIIATLRYLGPGFINLADNWRHSILVIDFVHPPELIPGLDDLTEKLSFFSILKELHSSDVLDRTIDFSVVSILFLPAILYRWSLKSTAWLYLPLLYIYRGRHGPSDDGRELLSDICEGLFSAHSGRQHSAYYPGGAYFLTQAIGNA